MEYLILVPFGLGVAFMAYQVIKHRGIKGAMFGAPIARTIGEVELDKRRMVRMHLKVHCLETAWDQTPLVGVEVRTSTVGSWGMMPIVLSREHAIALARLLSDAAIESEAIRAR